MYESRATRRVGKMGMYIDILGIYGGHSRLWRNGNKHLKGSSPIHLPNACEASVPREKTNGLGEWQRVV